MASQPNIVLITCHDLGQHVGCYGLPTAHTPSMDRLASEGVRFANSFCVAPQCSPSRATLYTGRYPHSNGVMGLTHASFAWDLHPGEQHLAAILQHAGYRTGLVGLQHEARHPDRLGFDDLRLKHAPCGQVARATIEYLHEVGHSSTPFYLQVGFIEPHRRFDYGDVPPDDSLGVTIPPYLQDEPPARAELAAFQGAIRAVDGAIGDILRALDELGLAQESLTIFTSDHGIPFPRAKCSLYDPGLQVSLIMRWPSRGWAGGRTCTPMISNVDYVPTLLEALEQPLPANLQGQSFCALLDGHAYTPRSAVLAEMTYHDYYDPRRCIRTPDFKLIVNFSSAPFFMDPSQSWRPATVTREPASPAYAYHPDLELYDLGRDPHEFVNLAEQPDYQETRRLLVAHLYEWMVATQDPLLVGVPLSPQHQRALAALRV